MALFNRRARGSSFKRFCACVLAVVLPAALLAVLNTSASAAPSSGACTMVGKGTFPSGANKTFKEDSVSTDTSAPQHLVLRSVTGPGAFFRLATVTSAACHRNASFPPEETGSPVNVFTGDGTGSFGTSSTTLHSGYTIRFEGGDFGDGGSSDDPTADHFSFTVRDSHGAVVWTGRGNLLSGSQGEEIEQGSTPPPPPPGSCLPSSSLAVLVQGHNVVSYVPKGSWSSGTTGISAVNVEGSAITPTLIPTPSIVNSAASNPITGKTVATANNTDVYILSGTTLTNTLTSGGSGTIGFSGGSATNTGVAMDATHNRALIGESVASQPGFQFLDLSSNTFLSPFPSPSGEISEDPLIDPVRNLILSASEGGNYEIIDVANPASPKFFERQTGAGELDSSGEDCSTGIALAPAEFSNPSDVFVADLSQAVFTPGSPGSWTAPSQIQSLTESSLSAGANGLAVAQGTHTGVVAGEFGGNALPATAGTGTPAITDWVTCNIPNTPDGNTWSQGLDPHTMTAYQSPNGAGNAMGLFGNQSASWLARVDLSQMLNPASLPRTGAGHGCSAGTLPSSLVNFTPVP
jgi:hypothetical protein